MNSQQTLLRYQFSWILVPLFFILFIYLPQFRIQIQYILFLIGFTGIIVSMIILKNPFLKFISIMGHLPTFIWIFWGTTYLKFDILLIFLYLFSVLFLFFIPFWPYLVSRRIFFYIVSILSIIYGLLIIFKNIILL